MKIPTIMILDREPDCMDTVINIEFDDEVCIIHALEDITVSFLDTGFPQGTLRFKAGQVLMMQFTEE